MDVALVRWPSERDARNRLAETRLPRLLLVEPGAKPPPVTDCLEDWIQLPAADAEVEVRSETLRFRGRTHAGSQGPQLDRDGVLVHAGVSVTLSPLEARLTAALVDHIGAVVSRHTLSRAGWPGEVRDRNALDVRMLRLRRKLAAAGLDVRTVRSRGYLLVARDERRPSTTAGSAPGTDCDQETVADP